MTTALGTASSEKPREKDKILADLELTSKRRTKDRERIRKDPGNMAPGVFNEITGRIAKDSQTIESLLGELFEVMCWENPELLGAEKK